MVRGDEYFVEKVSNWVNLFNKYAFLGIVDHQLLLQGQGRPR